MTHCIRRVVVALGAMAVSATADAALIEMQLDQVIAYGAPNGFFLDLSQSTATWVYDDNSGFLSQTGGTLIMRRKLTPTTITAIESITGMTAGRGLSVAASYTCTEGNYGALIARSICGAYSWGANFTDESTLTYGPGTSYFLDIAGDDYSLAPQSIFNFGFYTGFSTASWDGYQLKTGNAACFAHGDCAGYVDNLDGNFRFVLHATPVPIPGVAWLLPALVGLLSPLIRRRTAPER